MLEKLEKWLRVALIVSGILAAWAFGLNQFAGFMEAGRTAELRQVEAACVEFGAPHALLVDGTAYCYMVYRGNEQMLPLETLKKLYQK